MNDDDETNEKKAYWMLIKVMEPTTSTQRANSLADKQRVGTMG